MANTTNFERFKKMQEAKNKKATGTSQYNWFKLVTGKTHTLRFLPLKNEELQLPITNQHYHAVNYPDGKFETVVCPKKTGASDYCPFCAEASRVWKKFSETNEESYKQAAKDLFPKSQYLMVGYDPADIPDGEEIKPEMIKIVKISSKNNQQTIDNKLAKGIDFVDFEVGRNVELLKTDNGGMGVISLDFQDPEPAFAGKSGKKHWDNVVAASPDLTPLVTALSADELNQKFSQFSAVSVVAKPVSLAAVPSTVVASTATSSDSFDLDELRRSIED